ncbi:polysaccharide biosynthesis tyrosine autokinase [Mycolicibacterium austroafricanum]|uniref:polysaccharide biosynthesis tyrosine autokinase n=1 Tax=Mycolicibacterium austroafricanum TaxID=39687 RepID=UPI001ABFE0F6|nr:polysaccharide biosynthesis tyrosine autokinase [Mycolicibacterium austroafricanum]QRZ08326.1 polysaccharide biosynthesis tyrosine autokinase [Mycolicibacterium austroafricanum]QZT69978.1 polysaccharide biosynthesis tyrosine autokinase [Mycolicibacterium austroafricanum]
MSLQEFIKLLRTRWITVCVAALSVVLGAVVITLLTTPMYQASTRLFVSTTAGSSLAETYQGNRFSQERVKSYAELLTGETLAQRTIDKLDLEMGAAELQSRVSASAKLDTVLINVAVLDPSPVRARDIANTLSDEFVSMVRELETPGDGAAADARVVVEQRASIPSHPVIPKTSRNLGIGVLLGLALGIGLAVIRDMLDNTVKDRDAIERITGAGIVGTVPLDKDRRKQPAISFDNDNSAIAEAFRKLRTNLHFLAVDNPPRVIVVTSSMPSEGKSTTAINLALALAEADHKVVLVDGDMRRPALHRYLDLVGPVGFSTVLSGGASLNEALQKTRFSGLSVLTSGTIPPNPSELLGSQSARKLLMELRSEFDYVIVDSTPLLAVTDAAILGAGADGVLIMARYGQTRREQLTHAVESLRNVGAPLLGAVFTLTPTRRNTAYTYSYYGEYGSTRSASNEVSKSRQSDPNNPAGPSSTVGEPGNGIAQPTGGRRRKREQTDD